MTATVPGAEQLLAAQIQVEDECLQRAEHLLSDAQIDERLRDAVRYRFAFLFSERRSQLDAVRTLLQNPGDGLGPGWSFLRMARQDNVRLLRECLAFLQGALLRSAGMDGGVCELADHLLGELRARTEIPWSRLTILAEGELIELSTEIVRLRFPQVGVWRLPLMAHEFGHLVVSELEAPDANGLTKHKPLEQFVDADPGLRFKLRELCSDVFAVYMLGPAFACNAILIEFDPSSIDDEPADARHPSDGKRAHVILNALQRLDDDRDRFNKPFTSFAGGLVEMWRLGRTSAGKPPELDSVTQGQLDVWLEQVWTILSARLPTVIYDRRSWSRALRLASDLPTASPALDALDADDSLGDVLNAAWSARLSGEHAGDNDLGRRAVDFAQAVMNRGGVS